MNTSAIAPQTVEDLMSEDLIAMGPTDRIGRARDLMIGLGIHALPVMDGNDVVGIVTTADLVDDWPENLPVSDIMSASPYDIGVDATLVEAAREMLRQQVHHLIVREDRLAVGILSSFDLLRAFTATPA